MPSLYLPETAVAVCEELLWAEELAWAGACTAAFCGAGAEGAEETAGFFTAAGEEEVADVFAAGDEDTVDGVFVFVADIAAETEEATDEDVPEIFAWLKASATAPIMPLLLNVAPETASTLAD